ncbi:formate dehydrogenase subunit gamma [Undibacterium sp. SXout11W]|uniref:formate dehydrogenase subunit gamma n=1 Tax=Undibacterium sp. SXout11W TaxID=3413050 RepID=UPI003BF09A33
MSEHKDNSQIERYTADDRSFHWATAISFILLAISGLALFHPSLFWLSNVLGGGQWTRILHPFIGLLMFGLFAVLVYRFWHHNVLEPVDKQWMKQFKDVLNNREEKLPHIGRYNAGQKTLFFVLVGCMVGLLLSGLVIWRAYFSWVFPIELIRFSALLHAFCAFVLIVSIIVHVYAAIWVKGSIGAMVRGTVSLGWARKHHRLWFDEVMKASKDKK